jgi:phage-related protein
MAWDVLTPGQAPSQDGYQGKTSVRLLTSQFGDGYVQRAPDGLNFVGRTQTLTWTVIHGSLWAPIQAFLDAHVAVPFTYALPSGEGPTQWTHSGYTLGNYDGQNWYGNSVQLTQDFTPPT